jgi:hypothetical protein
MNLPLLKFFAHLDDEALTALTRGSLRSYFGHLQAGTLLAEARKAIGAWKAWLNSWRKITGSTTVESQLGQGTRFEVYFPA